MKRGTPDHPKTRRLARRLGIHLAQAVGHLEMLWHWTTKFSPRGDAGRHQDADIEEGCGWPGEPGALVAALTAERWLDEDDEHRLLVHDWPEHADTGVHRQLARALEFFADGTGPTLSGLGKGERPRIEEFFAQTAPPRTRGADVRTSAPLRPSDGSLPRPAPPRPSNEPPLPPSAAAAGGPDLSRKTLLARQERLLEYWVRLGGRPDKTWRRKLWSELRAGCSDAQLRSSIEQLVREDLRLPRDAPLPGEYSAQPP